MVIYDYVSFYHLRFLPPPACSCTVDSLTCGSWLAGLLVYGGWLVAGSLAGWLASCFAFVWLLAGWLAVAGGCLVGCLVSGWLAGWVSAGSVSVLDPAGVGMCFGDVMWFCVSKRN